MGDGPFVLVVTGLAFEARIAGGGNAVRTCCGQGAHLRAAMAEAGEGDCRGVISFGIAGGLDPALGPGAILVGTEVGHGEDVYPTDAAWRATLCARLGDATQARLAASDSPAIAPAAKAAVFRRSGALALDMESHIAAAYAAGGGAFAAVRVVADTAVHAVPQAAIAGMRADGTMDAGKVLQRLLKRPGELIPLAGVAISTFKARRALVRARGLLGPGFGLLDLG